MNNISVGQSHFQISGIDSVSNLTVYKVPAPSIDQEGEFIMSISGAGPASTITLSDANAIELVSLLTGLLCNSEIERLKPMNDGTELPPLSLPLQNLLRHIHHAAAEKNNGNK